MSSNLSSAQLPSGTYFIWTGDHELLLTPYRPSNSARAFVVTRDTPTFEWDVLFDKGKRLYAIKIHNQQSYIIADGTGFVLASTPQFFDIQPADEGVYEIRTADHRLVQYNSDRQSELPNRVTSVARTNAPSPLWAFEELGGDISPPSPYSIYANNSNYFEYSEEETLLPRFGLKDDSQSRWKNLKNHIRRLNADRQGSVIYKLIFLGLSGSDFSELDPDQVAQMGSDANGDGNTNGDGNGDLEWDAALTQDGFIQALNVHDMWITESSLPNGGIGVPQISYCSPLTRTLSINSITFSKQLEDATIKTVVVENCRELIDDSEGRRRRTAEYINLVFPDFTLGPGFGKGDDR